MVAEKRRLIHWLTNRRRILSLIPNPLPCLLVDVYYSPSAKHRNTMIVHKLSLNLARCLIKGGEIVHRLKAMIRPAESRWDAEVKGSSLLANNLCSCNAQLAAASTGRRLDSFTACPLNVRKQRQYSLLLDFFGFRLRN